MPFNDTLTLPDDDTPLEVTQVDVVYIVLHNRGTVPVEITATATGGTPDFAGAYDLEPGQVWKCTLAEFFPGIENAARIHARARGKYGKIFGSHA